MGGWFEWGCTDLLEESLNLTRSEISGGEPTTTTSA